MPLDFVTLLAITAINLCMLAAVLPLIMGAGVSRAARSVQASILLQALGWVALIVSTRVRGTVWDQMLSTASMAAIAGAQWTLFIALRDWLGPRPGARWVPVLAIAIPLGYTLGFGHYAFRVGWSNFLLAALVLLVARATLAPQRPAQGRWRMLLCACLLLMAGFTAARGALGAFTSAYPSFSTPHPVNVGSAIAANVTAVLGIVALMVAWRTEAEDRLRALATTDALTGIANRRGFDLHAQTLLAEALEARDSVTAVMFDLDHFKRINDTYGHDVGDRALKLFARLLSEALPSGALAGRMGGEEFVALLKHRSDTPAAQQLDRRLRARLAAETGPHLGFSLDYSAGAATVSPQRMPAPVHLRIDLTARADAALYQAKERGRGLLMEAGVPA
ncbi:GGDEF domain-containing protein [Paracidovorax wautersii]|uniref:diguanylate cyclase n=1 Tax=Paracidovorax wautersii TaxID=1177982 RepID=A0ABU1I6U4_9BURK|nr:GGDEF domain-containing protein [Paracidovorax wautersii]MDR6212935.1 diguanylate cyclase [Paracidovorax wautersii]